jgi:hypothetical protein
VKVKITARVSVYYSKTIEISKKELSRINQDIENFGYETTSDIIDIRLHSNDCKEVQFDDLEIEVLKGGAAYD